MHRVPFFLPLLFAIVGILIAYFFPYFFPEHPVYLLFIFLFLVLCMLFATTQRWLYIRNAGFFYFGISTVLLFVFRVGLTQPYEVDTQVENQCYGTVVRQIKSTDNYVEYLVNVEQIKTTKHNRKSIPHTLILMHIGRERDPSYLPGDACAFTAKVKSPSTARYPWLFDRAEYLRRKNVHYIAYVNEIAPVSNYINPLFYINRWAEQSRLYIVGTMQQDISNIQTRGIVEAMLLGYKDEISKDTFQLFSDTGALHILAVSGMHVAVIYAAFAFLFIYPGSPGRYRVIKGCIIFLCIWFFICVTGLSPSAMRAGTMLSTWLIAEMIGRKRMVLNTLCLSAFFLLFYEPYWLFDTGFHLSFLAVCGIVFFSNSLMPKWAEKFIWLQYIVGMAIVSIGAQIGTLFVSGYYFEKIPTYFLPANIVAVPAATFIVYAGVVYLLMPLPVLKQIVIFILDWLVKILFLYIEWLRNLTISVIDFPLPWYDGLLGSIVVLILGVYVYTKKGVILRLVISMFTTWMLISGVLQYKQHTKTMNLCFETASPVWLFKRNNTGLLLKEHKNRLNYKNTSLKKWLGVTYLYEKEFETLPKKIPPTLYQ